MKHKFIIYTHFLFIYLFIYSTQDVMVSDANANALSHAVAHGIDGGDGGSVDVGSKESNGSGEGGGDCG